MSDETTEVERLRQDLSDARDQLEAMARDVERLRAELASAHEKSRAHHDEAINQRAARERAEATIESMRRGMANAQADGNTVMAHLKLTEGKLTSAIRELDERPTAWVYEQTRKALETQRDRAERAERERDEARAAAGMNRLALAKRAELLEAALRDWYDHIECDDLNLLERTDAALSPPVEAGEGECTGCGHPEGWHEPAVTEGGYESCTPEDGQCSCSSYTSQPPPEPKR